MFMTKRKQIKVIGFRNMAYFSLLGTLGYEIKIEICPICRAVNN